MILASSSNVKLARLQADNRSNTMGPGIMMKKASVYLKECPGIQKITNVPINGSKEYWACAMQPHRHEIKTRNQSPGTTPECLLSHRRSGRKGHRIVGHYKLTTFPPPRFQNKKCAKQPTSHPVQTPYLVAVFLQEPKDRLSPAQPACNPFPVCPPLLALLELSVLPDE